MGKIIRFRKTAHESVKKHASTAVRRNVAAFAADSEGQYVFVNSHWSRLTGIGQDSALGDGWLQSVHPGDQKEVWRNWRSTIKGERYFGLLYRIHSTKGGDRWVLNQAIPQHDDDGDLTGYTGTIVDLSELSADISGHSAKAHLQVILDLLALSYYEHDFMTGDVSCSPSCFELIQGARTLQDYDALLHPEDLPRVNEQFEQCVKDGSMFQAEYRIAARGQGWRRIRDYAKIIYAEDGTPSCAVGFMAPVESFVDSKEQDGVMLLCRLTI